MATGKIRRWRPVANTMAYHRMSDDEVWAFLESLPAHTGKLATTRADGSAHVAPIWYAVDGTSLVFMTDANTIKGRNLRRDPRRGAVRRRGAAALLLRRGGRRR